MSRKQGESARLVIAILEEGADESGRAKLDRRAVAVRLGIGVRSLDAIIIRLEQSGVIEHVDVSTYRLTGKPYTFRFGPKPGNAHVTRSSYIAPRPQIEIPSGPWPVPEFDFEAVSRLVDVPISIAGMKQMMRRIPLSLPRVRFLEERAS